MIYGTALLAVVASTSLVFAQATRNEDQKTGQGTGGGHHREDGRGGKQSYGSLNSKDGRFLHSAIRDGRNEVEMGRMGVEKASDSEVKTYAQRMIDEHSKANSELEALAQQKGMAMMTQEKWHDQTGTKPGRDAKERFSGLNGAPFDRMFLSQMVEDHQKAVAHFEDASKTAADQDLRQFTAKLLPTLRDHLAQAQSLQSRIGGVSGNPKGAR